MTAFTVPACIVYIDPCDMVVLNDIRLEARIAADEGDTDTVAVLVEAFAFAVNDIASLPSSERPGSEFFNGVR